mgnify:CR=1 FL=1
MLIMTKFHFLVLRAFEQTSVRLEGRMHLKVIRQTVVRQTVVWQTVVRQTVVRQTVVRKTVVRQTSNFHKSVRFFIYCTACGTESLLRPIV